MTHRIAVERGWLERGELVELELPRNLTCAKCDGGGCDRCERAGAISLRHRSEAVERVQITLPRRTSAELSEQPILMLRIPEQGGHAPPAGDLPRGFLLLKVVAADRTDPSVLLIQRAAELEPMHGSNRADAAPVSRRRLQQRRIALALSALGLLLAAAASVYSATH